MNAVEDKSPGPLVYGIFLLSLGVLGFGIWKTVTKTSEAAPTEPVPEELFGPSYVSWAGPVGPNWNQIDIMLEREWPVGTTATIQLWSDNFSLLANSGELKGRTWTLPRDLARRLPDTLQVEVTTYKKGERTSSWRETVSLD